MLIPQEIQALVDRLGHELDQIEQAANEGLNIVRLLLLRFPDNISLVRLSATLGNALFFVDNFRRRIQTTVEKVSSANVTVDALQEAGEDLSEFLGRVLDTKILVDQAISLLRDVQ